MKKNILIILLILLFSFTGSVESINPVFDRIYDIGVNYKIVEVETSEGNNLELRFELITLDILRRWRIDFYNSSKANLLRNYIVFNVFIENKDSDKSNFQTDKVKLIINGKKFSSIFKWKTPIIDYTEGLIAYPLKYIENFNFEKFKLAIDTKQGIKYINFDRDKLDYDLNEKFRKKLPKSKDYDFYITNPKLGVLNDNVLKTKRNFTRNTVSNITLSFSLGHYKWYNKKHTVRCEWYNKNGFYSEEVIEKTKDRKFNFSLDKEDVKENVGIWSVLIYIDNHLMAHKTFLVN